MDADAPLFRPPVDPERRIRRALLALSLVPGLALIAWAFALLFGYRLPGPGADRWVDVLTVGVLIALGPYGFYRSRRFARLRALEARFPDFLRDIASSHQGGLTLVNAVQVAARADYGELTPEIRTMAAQLELNVSFEEVLHRFADRVPTSLVRRAVSLIDEAGRSGGNTVEVLLAASRDVRDLRSLDDERQSTMALYTAVIYLTFLVFLGIAAVLYNSFLPSFLGVPGGAATGTMASDAPGRAEYRSFYFLSGLVQGVGNGFVAGALERGKMVAGLRHSFTMAALTFVTFVFLLR